MLSSKDITGTKFDKVMGRGYKVEEVERFLGEVARTVDELEAQKQEAEQKLMVLAEKLEEYKQDEDSLRSALIGAQKLGDSVIREARAKAKQLLDDANLQAAMLVDNAKKTIEREQSAFLRMQREVTAFKTKLQHMYKQHLELISSLPSDEKLLTSIPPIRQEPVMEEQPQPEEQPDYAPEEEAVMQDEAAYGEELPEEADPLEYTEEPPYDDEEEEAEPRARESHFGPLKFGKEYDIKRDGKRRK